jgi:Fe-S-cluster containining protein
MMSAQRDFNPFLQVIHAIPMQALETLAELYEQLDHDIARRKPICNTSGRCCKFEAWGHRLYVSTLELASFQHITGVETKAKPFADAIPRGITFPLPLYMEDGEFSPGCPWQIDGLCTARAARPLGCRIYFCDTTAESWQQERYEHYHQKIVALHEEFLIPYRYMEWRQALALLNQR